MRNNLAMASVLASTILLTTAALAQQTPPPASSAPSAASTTPAPQARNGQWRVSKLMGLDVYNEQNEKLGDVNEVLLDTSGKVTGIVIGVGGFLGVGERDIVVTMDKLKFVNEPMRMTSINTAPSGTTASGTSASGTTASGTTASGTTNAAARTDRTASRWYPDHAILSGVSKEQLKTMKEIRYD